MSTTFTRQDYSVGTSPVDLEIADINGDGNLDLVVTNVGSTAKLLVLLGSGTGSFSTSTNIDVTTGEPSMGFAKVADMNGDGHLDIVFDSYYDYSVRVLLSDGAGGYQAGPHASFWSRPMSMAIGDVNGDGRTDAVTTSQNGVITVLLGDGQGGFQSPINNASITSRFPGYVALADMNGDGKLDIVASGNSSFGNVSVMLGDGAGGFTAVTHYSMGTRLPGTVTVADVNGDGKLDALTTNIGTPGTVSVLLGNGNGGFTSATDISVGANPGSLTVADLNGDGKLDLITANSNANSVSVRWGDGSGNFSGGTDIAVGSMPRSVKVADVNKDGRMDIVVTTVMGGGVTVLLGGKKADVTAISSSATGTLKTGDTVTFTLTTDVPVTVNGMPELVLSNGGRAVYAGLDQNGRPTFAYTVVEGDTGTSNLTITGIDSTDGSVDGLAALSFETPTTVGTQSSTTFTAIADVNRDGKLDLVTTNGQQGTVAIQLGEGAGGFSAATQANVGYSSECVVVRDVNGDGKLDLLVAESTFNVVAVRLGDGNGNFYGLAMVPVDSMPVFLTTGDVNGDGKLDLVTANELGISVRLGDGAGSFSGSTEIAMGATPLSIALADVNGDGKLDILAADSNASEVYVKLGDGAGNFSGTTQVGTANSPSSVAVADVNGDGKLDLLTTSSTLATVSVHLGDGDGGFSGATQVSIGSAANSIAIGDLNGDGKLDLVTGNAAGSVSIRLGDGAGNFSGSTDIGLSGSPDSIALADVNGDGKLDIVVPNEGRISVILNNSRTAASFFDGTTISTADGSLTGLGVDATRPDAPDLTLADDSGTSATDLLTNDGSLTIGKEVGATLSYVVDGGQASASYDPTALADGEHTIEVTQTDLAGNVSLARSITFTIDRTAPDAVVLALASDSGTSSTDKLTNNGALSVSGLEDGATLSYVVDGGAASSSFDSDGLADGEHTVEVTQTDAAGNVSTTRSITFTLDRTALAPVLALTSDTGSSSTDKITSSGALTMTRESGATLSYVVDGGTASSSYDPSTLADGTHTVEVVQTDLAGNVSDAGSITFTIDKTVLAPALALTSDTGASSIDKITSSGALTITKENGATLSYIVDGGAASSSYDPSALANGTHTVEVVQTDVAGNVSDARSITFTLDRAKPAVPVLSLSSDTGSSSTDRITSNGALTIAGKESGTTLSYIVDGGPVSSTYNPSALTNGAHTVKVIQTDKAGNVSSAGILTFTLDKAAPTVTGVTVSGPGVSGGSGTLTTGQTAEFKLTLSEAVVLTGATKLTLTLSNGKQAIYDAAASSSKTLVFDYKVGLEDTASDLSVTKLNLNGATIKDAAGNVLNITGASINPAGKLVIDGYTGTSAADVFNGTVGAETFRGLAGNDIYVVNNNGDVLVEGASAGTDLVKASVNYTLTSNVENLTLTGSGKINGTGNGLANILTGNGGDNVLDGKGGADRMIGGKGNDTYVVDNVGDVVVEGASAGTDLVKASVNYTLTSNVENLMLTGSGKINAVGNGIANILTGNDADNVLDGKAGADRLIGGKGNDTYVVDNAGDVVVEGTSAGADLVKASVNYALTSNVENLTLTGSTKINGVGNTLANILNGNSADNILDGKAGNDTLVGASGADKLYGGAGADKLTGGSGADVFLFKAVTDTTVAAAGRDTIIDFNRSQGDKISLNAIDANPDLKNDQAFTFIDTQKFHKTAGELRYEIKSGDTFISGDINGDGTADFSIRLDLSLAMKVTDFIL
ncbi:MAG: beta strand repeat-containing protein [Shinella sp.]|uniref:beta strand repeat-containing protein n=3 Tax=Shinella sp. TaxID=1870904 RepID=UPI0040351B5C